jgi:hypothetical protein
MSLGRFRPKSGGKFNLNFHVDLQYSWVICATCVEPELATVPGTTWAEIGFSKDPEVVVWPSGF